MREEKHIRKAEFNSKVCTYSLLSEIRDTLLRIETKIEKTWDH